MSPHLAKKSVKRARQIFRHSDAVPMQALKKANQKLRLQAFQYQQVVQSLRKSEQRWKAVFENAQDGVLIADVATKRFVRCNKKIADMLGYTRAEILSLSVSEIHPSKELKSALKEFSRLAKGEASLNSNVPVKRKDGSVFYAEVSGSRVEFSGRQCLVGFFRDITGRKLAEERERETSQRLQAIFDSAFQFIALLRSNGKVLEVNQSALKFGGLTPQDVRNKSFWNCHWWTISKRTQRELRKAVAQAARGRFVRYPVGVLGKKGASIAIDFSLKPVRNKNGQVILLIAEGHDITERNRAEEQLRESEMRFRSLFESSQDAMMTLEPPSWRFTSANGSMARMFKAKNVAELCSHSPWELSPKFQTDGHASTKKAKAMIQTAVRKGSHFFEWTHRRIDGKTFPAEVLLTRVAKKGGIFLQATVRDIAERKQAEEALREGEEKMRLLFEKSPIGIAMCEMDGTFVEANQAYLDIIGYTHKEAMKLGYWDVTPKEYDKDEARQLRSMEETGKYGPYEKEYIRKTGERVSVLLNGVVVTGADGVKRIWSLVEDITERKRAESLLKESERSLRESQTIAGLGSYVLDIPSGTWESSLVLDAILGIDEDCERSIKGWIALVHPDWQKSMLDYFKNEVLRRRGSFDKEYKIIRRQDGQERWVHGLGELELDAKGRPVKMVGTIMDITRRKCAEEELKRLISLQRATLESTADGILVVDRAGKVTDFNKRFLQLWKLPPQMIASRDDKKLLRAVLNQLKDPKGFLAKVHYLYGHPEKNSFDMLEFRDGRFFERYSHPQRVDGRPAGRVWSFRDVTRRMQAEEELRISRQRMVLHIKQTPLAVIEWDENFEIREWNPAAEKIFGYTRAEAFGRYWDFIVPESTRAEVAPVGKALIAQKGGQRSTNKNITKSGKIITCEWFNTTLVDPTGKTIGVASLVEDVTVRVQAEEQVRRTHLQYQQLVENAKDGIFTINAEGRFLLANPEIRRMLGYAKKEFIHLNILDTYSETSRAEGKRRLAHLLQGKTMRFDRLMRRKNGSSISVEVIAWKTSDGHVQAFVRDITDRKRAEEALRESRRQLLQIIDTVPHMIFAKDKDGRFLLVNRALAQAYQQEPKDLIGVRRQDVHKDREEAERSMEVDREILATGKPKIVSNEIFTDSQGRRHVLQTIKIPFEMVGVEETCILGVSVDVTEQKKGEEFRNDIVRTVSHELRTPLSIEKEGISLLLDGVAGAVNSKQKEILETVMRSINRLSRMITSLLDISSIETGKTELWLGETSLDDLARDVVFEFKKRAEQKRIELKVSLPEGRAQVFADADKITQVLSNLVDNAIKFTPEKGLVEISIAILKNEVECTIGDTGIGISEENIPKIFEKFQQFSRTAGPGEKGFGLGLSIVKGIIDMHRGRIWAKSELGKGTRVTFVLPLCGPDASKDSSKMDGTRRKKSGSLGSKREGVRP